MNARWIALVAALAVGVYANTLGHGFALDDRSMLTQNASVESLHAALWSFRQHAFAGTDVVEDASLYRPIPTVTFALGHALHGLEPFGYHLANVLLHALVSVLVCLLARRYAAPAAACAAGALFAVHPIHTEAVANVAGRAELLAAAGIVAALLAWDRARTAANPRAAFAWSAACVAAAAFALFSKESGIVVLPLAGLAAWLRPWPRASRSRALALGGALVVLCAAYLAIRASVTGDPPAAGGLRGLPADQRVATALRVLVEQLGQLLVPLRLSAIWTEAEVPVEPRLLTAAALASAALLAGLLALAWRLGTRLPAFAFGIGFLAIAVLPTANLLFPIGAVRAERLLYTPSIGFCVALAAVLHAAGARWNAERAFLGAALVLVLAWAARTVVRNPDWRDNRTLAEATARTAPRSALPWGLWTDWHVDRGELAEAAAALRKYVELQPGADAWMKLGDLERRTGRPDAARAAWERALRLEPARLDVLLSLSTLHLEHGRPADALPLLERLCARYPDLPAAHGNRIVALQQMGEERRAAELADEAARRFPDEPLIQEIARAARARRAPR